MFVFGLALAALAFQSPGVLYQSLEAEWHDLFWEAEGPAAELPLLRSFLKQHPGRSLELGCGSGRLLLPLLKEGLELEGLDNAPEMIALCEEAARAQELSPTLHCCDLMALPGGTAYQAVAIPAFTLQLLSDPIAAVHRIAQMLPAGGGLYFSVFYPWAELEKELPENEFYPDHALALPDGKRAELKTKYSLDRQGQILTRTHRYELQAGGELKQEHTSTQVIRYCTEEDWEHLLDATGFEVKKRIFDFEPQGGEDEETAGVTTYLAVRR